MAVDKTHLSIDQAETRGFLHRDYIAHCHRWTYVVKYLHLKARYKTARILDIGCGRDLPLARTLFTNRMAVEQYVGLDANKDGAFVDFNFGKMDTIWYGGKEFPQAIGMDDVITETIYKIDDDEYELPNLITSFEVLEHVEPAQCRAMIEAMFYMLAEDGVVICSTPVWDSKVGAAKNHLNEMTRDALGAVFEDVGFAVEENFGTFASIKDYKPYLTDAEAKILERLREYYDTNVLATIFAPMYPEYSRNNLWVLSRADANYKRKFPELNEVEGPWTSSDKWEELDDEGL
jgi:hypothetical protein